ncbi:MAG: alpha/beta hydrolase [Hyphomicrobiaceae bacterium]
MTQPAITLAGHRGHRIAASIEGPDNGFPVMLAHGGGQTRRSWFAVSQLLARHGFRSIAIDLRGHGDSAWADDGAYDIRDFANDIAAIANANSRRPALIGASLGGLAGIFAEGELSPFSFASLTLVDIAPQMEPAGVARIVGFMAAHAREGFASPEEAAQAISNYLPHRPTRKASSGLQTYLRRKEDGRYYWHWDPAFIDRIIRPQIADSTAIDGRHAALNAAAERLRLPVHLIRGGSSDLVSPEAVAHFKRLVPHAEYTDIADATHMVVGDQNDAFGQAIVEFLIRRHVAEVAS